MDGPGALRPYSLRFVDDAVEADFRLKHRPRLRRNVRIAVLFSVGLWAFFGVLLYPMVESGRAIFVIVPGMCVYLLASAALTWPVQSLVGLQTIGALSNTVAGISALLLVWLEGVFDALGGQVVMMILVFSGAILRLPPLQAVLAATPYLVLGTVMGITSPTITLGLVQASIVLTLASTVVLGAYLLESATRRDFFLRRVIADQERELVEEKAKQLGQYTLVEKVGEGGMGVVYRARHAMLRRPTAVKLLQADARHPERLASFEREVQLTSELLHPNIVAVYDYGHTPEGEFYYAMEYLPGLDLHSLVKRYGPLGAARTVGILTQVCDALDTAHSRGLIHRDIKPANIILSKLGKRLDVAKVVDFGLVREFDAEHDTRDGLLAGTPAYMAPEAVATPDRVGPPADLYALGAVGFFLLTGKPVFRGETPADVLEHHLHTDAREPSAPDGFTIPPALSQILLRCLAKDPAERFADAAALRAALDSLILEEPWGEKDALAWWDAYETDRRSAPEVGPLTGARTMTVALGDRDSNLTRNERANRTLPSKP